MAPLSNNMNETGLHQKTTTTTKLPSLSNSASSASSSSDKLLSLNGLRKQRLQHYIRKLKKAIINYDSNHHQNFDQSISPTSKKHLSTFEVLERAIQLISDSHPSNQWSKSQSTLNEHQMPSQPICSSNNSDETTTTTPTSSAPSSPFAAASSTASASSIEQQQQRQRQSQSPSSQTLLSNASSAITTTPTTSSSDRLWGTVSLSLPDGIITNLWSSESNTRDLPSFTSILQKGSNLLELLQGKGAQTLLLNAFCGSSKRRMYARLKCGNNQIIRPFEFICEFTPNLSNPSICSAMIQILCLESAFKNSTNFLSSTTSPTIFTTRHNASCALIYLDAASIPYLGHFPSEITGKSLFTFIHSDDVSIIQHAHQQLHANNGRLVSTPNLRLVSYSGTVIPVSSEWSAFVNPWTKTIEMIVGRHCINHQAASAANALSEGTTTTMASGMIEAEKFRELDSSIHSYISRPIISDEIVTPTMIVGDKVIKQEPSEEAIQQPIHQPIHQAVHQPLHQQQPQTLRSYIDNVVENLVISSEEKQQVQDEIKTLQEGGAPILSYNQINCLENVHRLLKSQSKFLEFDAKDGTKENSSSNDCEESGGTVKASSSSITLTRELLQQHNRKWESQCKDTWKKRLNMKRIASSSEQQPVAKAPRIRSEPQAYSISTTPLPPTSRVISTSTHPSTHPSTPTPTLPALPYPPPTPLDQQAWTEYVKLVQLHLQNMATIDQQQSQQCQNKRITSLQQHLHQQQQRVNHERQLAALAMTFQQVQIPPHHHLHQQHQHQSSTAASSPFNALPSLN